MTSSPAPQVPRANRRAVRPRLALVFDGQCGFCTLCVRALMRLDRHRRIHIVPFQDERSRDALGITRTQGERSVWAVPVDETGAPGPDPASSGAEAVARTLDEALGTAVFGALYRLPGVGPLQERAYAWVARHRGRLPGVTPWCGPVNTTS